MIRLKNLRDIMTQHNVQILSDLMDTINQRASQNETTSYTAKLLNAGSEHCAKKFGEEAFEVALASQGIDKKHVISEAGDVFYHLLVLLKSCDVELSAVMDELTKRTQQSGIEEKASRNNK